MQSVQTAVPVCVHGGLAGVAVLAALLPICRAAAPVLTDIHPSGLFRQTETADFEWHDRGVAAVLRSGGTVRFWSPATDIRLEFAGADRRAQACGESAAGPPEYYYAGTQSQWRVRRGYRAVRFDDLYPGISVLFRTDAMGRLEYDLEVRPGADPRRIAVRFNAPARLDESGSLLVGHGSAELVQHAPAVYQWKHGRKVPISARYRIASNGLVSFDLERYDRASNLIIDPVLSFTSMLDGSAHDSISAVAADESGNVYVAGETDSTSFGGSGSRPNRDAFVAKLARSPTGMSVVYVAYLGGASQDGARGIAIDSAGNAYVAGVTASPDFASTPGAFQTVNAGGDDAFVAKLDPGGRLLYSTLLGAAGSDSASSIGLDSNGNAVVAGYTSSAVFPGAGYRSPAAGQGECFVAKLNSSGTVLAYSALLGGSAFETCTAVAVDSAGAAYVTGVTYSADFPATNPSQATLKGPVDAFVARLDPSGRSLSYSTFLGGSGTDFGYAVAVDRFGYAYVAGATLSTDFPTTGLAYQTSNRGDYDAFAAKLAPDGGRVFATLLGGSGADAAYSVAVDQAGSVVLAGTTQSADLATVNAFQTTFAAGGGPAPGRDGFVAVLPAAGAPASLVSYAGGYGDDWIRAAAALNGRIYLAGETTSFDFPGSAQSGIQGTAAFLSEIDYGPKPLAYYPVQPCRVADTRSWSGKTGQYGPPSLRALYARTFPIAGACGIPMQAQAFSLNVTAIPAKPLDFLSVWPSGQPFPHVSTLNQSEGEVVANAAIVLAGAGGSVDIAAGVPADVIIDVTGYFAAPGTTDLALYLLSPCRVVETRTWAVPPASVAAPSLAPYVVQIARIPDTPCDVPTTAQAYSLNVTVAPAGPLSFLSAWPAGQPYPGVSTLNAPGGQVLANAALVQAGKDGGISFVASDRSDLIVDINAYFARSGDPGALFFYPIAPCRAVDTRPWAGKTGAFGPPALAPYQTRAIAIADSPCNVPPTAKAYSLNITVVPWGPLDFLSAWPAGQPYPYVSTLNSPRGGTLANAAIVRAGTNGAISIAAGQATDLIIDVNGYFAPRPN